MVSGRVCGLGRETISERIEMKERPTFLVGVITGITLILGMACLITKEWPVSFFVCGILWAFFMAWWMFWEPED